MKKAIMMGCLAFLATSCYVFGAHAAAMKEGLWSISTTVQAGDSMKEEMARAQQAMDSLPPEQKAMMKQMMGSRGAEINFSAGSGMTVTQKQCLSHSDPVPRLESAPSASRPAGKEDCEETHTVTGNVVQFDVRCADSRSRGEVTYQDETMTGRVQFTRKNPMGRQEDTVIDIQGRYEGPCRN